MKKLSINLLKLSVAILIILSCSSCAKSKEFVINGKNTLVQPYGWTNNDALKNDSIVCQMNSDNIILSVIFSETIVVPIWLTASQIYEPVRKVKSPK